MSKIRSKRYFILILAELLCLLILLPGCFKNEEQIYGFNGEDIIHMAVQVGDSLEFCGDRLELTPGVYEIRLQARTVEGQSISVEMKYENAYFRSLRSNAAVVFSGDDYLEIPVYVLDKVTSAYVQCNFYGVGAEGLEQLDVYRTNKGSRIVLFLAVIVFGALDFLIEFRRRVLDGRITKRQQVVFWSLTVGVLIAYFPYLTDHFSLGADTLFYVSRIDWLTETLEQGATFPIRIQSHWNYDHGYAVSMFYGDLFLFIPAILQLIGFSIMAAYKMFIFIMLAATAAISYWSFYKCVKDEYAALFGSVIYLLAPYHIYNVYSRGSLGECLAMTFLPLVASGMYLLYTEDITTDSYKKIKWYIILGLSAILESHVISTEMTVVFIVIFCIVCWKKTFRKETFLQLAQAAVITLLINMWFWLPLLYMMNADMYHLQSITGESGQSRGILFAGFLQLLPNKGAAQIGMWQCEPVQVGAAALMLLAVYLLWRNHRSNRACRLLAVFSILTLIMSTQYLPWDTAMKIPIIGAVVSSLQFPSRWMVLATFFVAMFAAFFYKLIWNEGGWMLKTVIGVATLLSVGTAVYHVNSIVYEMAPIFLYMAENIGTR